MHITSANTHIVLQKSEVFPPKGAVRQRSHLCQIERRQPDPRPFSARSNQIRIKRNTNSKKAVMLCKI